MNAETDAPNRIKRSGYRTSLVRCQAPGAPINGAPGAYKELAIQTGVFSQMVPRPVVVDQSISSITWCHISGNAGFQGPGDEHR